MDLRCKVVQARGSADLESALNTFLADEFDAAGEAQIEAITQSEGPHGVTVLIWYSLVDERALGEEPNGPWGDERRLS